MAVIIPLTLGGYKYIIILDIGTKGILGSTYFSKYCLTDFLWMFALHNAILLIWSDKPNIIWTIWVFLLGASLELMQYYKLINGTFDLWDIISYLLAIVLSYLIYYLILFFTRL